MECADVWVSVVDLENIQTLRLHVGIICGVICGDIGEKGRGVGD